MTRRKLALDSFLFDLKWFIKHAIILNDKSARWYWVSVKQSAHYLWLHKFNTNPVNQPLIDNQSLIDDIEF